MEPPPPSSTAAGRSKLRLMCSYGGHIVPRPPGPNKSFCYVGGDTRIVSFDRLTVTTLDLLVSHLSATLSVNFSFTLKYQLPHLDLNSLISLTSDEDFQILIDEYDRLCSTPPPSSAPSRIRVFLFHTVQSSAGRPVIRHPKTESWFFDALKGAKIHHGFGFCCGSGVEGHGFGSSGPETMVLETSSSFGSTSSSASLTNFGFKSQSNEDNNEFVLQDSKAMLIQNNTNTTFPSDNCVSNIAPHHPHPHHHHQNIAYQDPIIVHQASFSMEARAGYSTAETIIISETANSTNMVEVMGYNNTSFPQLNNQQIQRRRQQQQQQVPLLQQHTSYHQPDHHACPIYLVPYNNAQMPPPNIINTLPVTPSYHSSFMASPSYYRPAGAATTTPSCGNNKQQAEFIDVAPMYVHQSQNVAVTYTTQSPEHGGDGDDLDHALIYKSQPPPPS